MTDLLLPTALWLANGERRSPATACAPPGPGVRVGNHATDVGGHKEARMDPTTLLEADHRRVEAIDKAEGDDRLPLIEELTSSLRAHMQLEEQVLYPAMAPATGDEAVEEGNTEHELARKSLKDMVDLAPTAPDGRGRQGCQRAVRSADRASRPGRQT